MAERKGKRISKKVEKDAVEFVLPQDDSAGSPTRLPEARERIDVRAAVDAETAQADDVVHSLEFLELAEPKLPSLSRGNHARLLMQSPDRLYFYWSIGRNPFHTLNRALGDAGNYSLVLKLVNLFTEEEMIHPVNENGNWWFSVDPDSRYRAEIGFYAVNRPYIRVLFSNTVVTPRKSPSPRTADTAEWRVPANRFSRVLDAAGFARDAFDVALAGDDWTASEAATRSAFAQFTGRPHAEFAGIAAADIRYALFALASGASLDELRGLIGERLFSILSSMLGLQQEDVLAALKDRFEFEAEDFEIEEEAGAGVFGASLVAFPPKPKRIRKARNPDSITSHLFNSAV